VVPDDAIADDAIAGEMGGEDSDADGGIRGENADDGPDDLVVADEDSAAEPSPA
jgi:hypothetical protein